MKEIHFNKAPITEAVIEIRTSDSAGIAVEDLAQQISLPDYPTRKNRFEFQAMFKVGDETEARSEQKHVGFEFRHESDKQIIQVTPTTFSLSRLAPYGSWHEFSTEARRLWNAFEEAAKPQQVKRLAVRFVNRIDLPLPVIDLKEYLRTFPEVSPAMNQSLTGYLMRLQIPQPHLDAMLVLQQALTSPPSQGVISIILDIDLFQHCELKPGDLIWNRLDALREKKNEIFLACLTEKTLELFD